MVQAGGVGRLLREWRARRGMSQLDLAVEAGVSSRHLSFVETGRATPSREMVVLLARALDVPFRDRNDLLAAAGYAAIYRATSLDAPALAQARRALDFILRQQEPYPALVLDRHWNVLKVNEGSARVQALFLDAAAVATLGPPNAMRLMFHPKAFRPWIVNWEPTAASLIQWLHRDVATGFADAETRALLEELLSYPDTPRQWRALDLDASPAPFLPIEFRKGDLVLRYFTTLTTLGTPHDITLQELRVESFFPADELTVEMGGLECLVFVRRAERHRGQRHHAHQSLLVIEDRQPTDLRLGHRLHRSICGPFRMRDDGVARQTVAHRRARGIGLAGDGADDDVAVGDDAEHLTVFDDRQHPDVGVVHLARGVRERRRGIDAHHVLDHDVTHVSILRSRLALPHVVLLPESRSGGDNAANDVPANPAATDLHPRCRCEILERRRR